MIHTITIPGFTPVKINDWRGRHWSVRARLKKSQQELVGFYGRHVPRATGKRRVVLRVWGYWRGVKPDADGFSKDMLDCLVQLGLLTDDDEAGLDGIMHVEITRARVRETCIELEDVA